MPAGTTKGRSPSGGFALALWKPSPPAGGDSLKVAAALSAAVTTIYLQEIAPNLQAEPSLKRPRPPNASRSSGERGLGGEALLSEKRPLPPDSSPKFGSSLAKTGK